MKCKETAKRLQLALNRVEMKSQELSEKSSVSKASISQYVNGFHSPSNISSSKMAKALGVDPLWLMGFDVPMIKEADIEDSYYLNKDAQDMAQFLIDNPEYKVLFDASRKVKKEDIEFVKKMIDKMSK